MARKSFSRAGSNWCVVVAAMGLVAAAWATDPPEPEEFRIHTDSTPGDLSVTGAFTNGVCTILGADEVGGPWLARKNVFTTDTVARASVEVTNAKGFHRALARDLSAGAPGFTNLTLSYGRLSTIAGAGGLQDANNWRPEFEGGPATSALLSGPHIAMADRAGCIYIADKDAHGVRKVRLDGTIITVAGTSQLGNGPDNPTPATQVALTEPNGLWVKPDGTLFILDLGNGKIRRRDTNGMLQTWFTVAGGISTGRGLWVNEQEDVAYFCSGTVVKKWTLADGVTTFSIGYISLGNLVIDPWGNVVVTDRNAHRVYRLDSQGQRTVIAGNGFTSGNNGVATTSALDEVRGVWFLPTGGYFVATHHGSQVWYIDTGGFIYLFLNGNRQGAHVGDGTWFYNPAQARVSECRAITMDYEGNIIITENDVGYIRKVNFLPF